MAFPKIFIPRDLIESAKDEARDLVERALVGVFGLIDAAIKFYRDNPDKLRELVDTMHRGAVGEIELTQTQVSAFLALQRVVDQMHRKQDGTDRQVLEQITVIVPTDGRKPERAGLTIEAAAQSRPVLELPHDPTDPLDPRNAPHADPPAP